MIDLSVRQGDTEPVTFVCKSVDRTTSAESVVNFSGYTLPTFHAKEIHSLVSSVISTSPSIGFGVLANGEVIVALNSLSAGEYDVYISAITPNSKEVSFPSGRNFRLIVLREYP